MSDKHYVGLDITGFQDNGLTRPISRVTLKLDDDNVVTAGDDTGMELVADCAHGTQAMADAILSRMKGYQYQMFSADAARIDPAAELGDGVTVGGVYGVISSLSDDGNGYPNITAPGEAELEDEYPTAGPMTQEFNRKLAQTRSYINKTAEEIRAGIEAADGRISELSLSVDGISGTVSGLDGKISKVDQRIDSIKLSVSNGKTSSTITLTGDGISAQSQNITFSGFVTFDGLSGGTTTIDGACIKTGKIAAEYLQLTGSISWNDFENGIEDYIDEAHRNASDAASDAQDAIDMAQMLADGDYTGGTFIDGKSLYSPEIYTNELNIYSGGYESGTFNLYGYYNRRNRNVFDISYDSAGPYVRFESELDAEATFDFSYTTFNRRVAFDGDVQFNGSVTGISTLSLVQENSEELAQGDSPVEPPGIDVEPTPKERQSVKLSDAGGALKVELPSGKVWYLDDAGLHE